MVYRERTRLPATPLTQARQHAMSPPSPHSPHPHRTGLDGLLHGSLTLRAGFIVARATRDSLPASPPAGAAPRRTGCMMRDPWHVGHVDIQHVMTALEQDLAGQGHPG
jgi:hypothetical protein